MEQTSPQKIDILPVTDLTSRRDDNLQKKRKDLPVVRFDLRPPDYPQLTSEANEKFRCDLLSLNHSSAFLESLVPSVENIKHDHCYLQLHVPAVEDRQVSDEPQQLEREHESSTPEYDLDSEAIIKCAIVKISLILSHAEREKTEQRTLEQSNNHEWFKARSKRITGSKCGRILCQKKKSVCPLSGCLYPKPLVPLPKSIAWGRHYESIAIEKYTFHMKPLEKCSSQ